MTIALLDPSDDSLARLSDLSGGLCHYSPAFLRGNSDAPITLFLEEGADGRPVAGAVGYERRGRLFGKLTLPTLPIVTAAAPGGGAQLWAAIRAHCRSRRIATVSRHSFEGQASLAPPLGDIRSSTAREEFVVDLAPEPDRLFGACTENHRRNIKKAEKQQLAMSFVTADADAAAHAALFRHSMERRAARGEDVALDTDAHAVARLLRSGAGALAQVRRDSTILASLLILSTPTRAYYHSGGSAPEGMKLGASHFAVWRAMQTLRERGVRSFCLGGVSARDSEGLTNFKLGFAPRRVALAHTVYTMDLPSPWSLLRRLIGR